MLHVDGHMGGKKTTGGVVVLASPWGSCSSHVVDAVPSVASTSASSGAYDSFEKIYVACSFLYCGSYFVVTACCCCSCRHLSLLFYIVVLFYCSRLLTAAASAVRAAAVLARTSSASSSPSTRRGESPLRRRASTPGSPPQGANWRSTTSTPAFRSSRSSTPRANSGRPSDRYEVVLIGICTALTYGRCRVNIVLLLWMNVSVTRRQVKAVGCFSVETPSAQACEPSLPHGSRWSMCRNVQWSTCSPPMAEDAGPLFSTSRA